MLYKKSPSCENLISVIIVQLHVTSFHKLVEETFDISIWFANRHFCTFCFTEYPRGGLGVYSSASWFRGIWADVGMLLWWTFRGLAKDPVNNLCLHVTLSSINRDMSSLLPRVIIQLFYPAAGDSWGQCHSSCLFWHWELHGWPENSSQCKGSIMTCQLIKGRTICRDEWAHDYWCLFK